MPTQPARARRGAIGDRGVLRLTGDAAPKGNALPSYSGHASGMSSLQTQRRVEAWVRKLGSAKSVRLDVHAFDRDGRPLTSETLPLWDTRAAGDGGDHCVFDGVVHQGSAATQGSVDPRPDAWARQYRIYGEQGARVHTDGLQHGCEPRTDVAGG